MRPFTIESVTDPAAATTALLDDPEAMLIAGGTEVVNWLKDGIARPARLLDITGLPGLDTIEAAADGLRVGALVTMADLAAHPDVRRDYPAITEALLRSASQQLRNMATIGGNLMQRTRCPYFRAETDLPCNQRRPGSGCSALKGTDRGMAIFGWSEHCVATHPSDLAVALAALDAEVVLRGPSGVRSVPLTIFYSPLSRTPSGGSALRRGELITGVRVPRSELARHSWYLKVRERVSYEFALVSVAAAVTTEDDGVIGQARIALGGVAYGPWRLREAEATLPVLRAGDDAALRAVIDGSFGQARPRRDNGFKIELAKRAVLRALRTVREGAGGSR